MTDRILVFSTDDQAVQEISRGIRKAFPFLAISAMNPAAGEVPVVLEEGLPFVIFIDASEGSPALAWASEIFRIGRDARVVAFFRSIDNNAFLELKQCGVRECVRIPYDENRLRAVLSAFQEEVQAAPAVTHSEGQFFSFLPAKPGAGTSTLAYHFAHALAEKCGERVALIDLDLNCGLLAFLTRFEGGVSLQEAVQYAGCMDETIWDKSVARNGQVDVVCATRRAPGSHLDAGRFQRLLEWVRCRYSFVVFDHSGSLERHSLEVLNLSWRIFHVCAADLASLHHARTGADILFDLGHASRVCTVLNRTPASQAGFHAAVQGILGFAPHTFLPNCYNLLQEALQEGGLAARHTEYGKACSKLAARALQELPVPREVVEAENPRWGLAALRSVVGLFRDADSAGLSVKP
jgi:Flp pilus assembly CpaE family ATPase